MAAPSNSYPVPPRPIDTAIVPSIRQASQSTDTDFGLLMAEAAQESSFRSDAKAATGSAAGLYQFIGSTWLEMVHRFGAKYGLGALAQQITTTPSGRFRAVNPAARREILALRNDPSLAAAMAGEYANLNKGEV
ncbi:MAG: transglycosylase SLT domain-containing protein, partial [Stellaceae bacterium]